MLEQTGWNCIKCDHYNDSGSLVCENCGENIEFEADFNHPNICPVCGQIDAIQRLSAVALGGKFYLPQLDRMEIGSTELARLLAPPPSPNPTAGLNTTTWIGLSLFFGFWPVALITTNYLYYNFGQEFAEGLYPLDAYLESLLSLAIPASIVIFALVIIVLILIHFISKKKAEKKFESEKPIWERAMMHWNTAYYCHRDGVVFASETDKVFAVQDIYTFLYSDWQ